MITLVVISLRQDVNLVSENYYEQEIQYQQQIDMERNFQKLEKKPEVQFNLEKKVCLLKFPEELLQSPLEGSVHFFRPSDSKMDKIFEWMITSGNAASMDLTGLEKGLWEVRIEWTSGSEKFFFQESVFL